MAEANPITLKQRIHDDIIEQILSDWPNARTKGLMGALKQLPDAEYMQWLAKEDRSYFDGVRFIPDAWLIDTEKRHVVVFEAIHSHDVSADKFAKMADLSWALDEDYYKLILVRCDRFSRRAYDVQGASLCSELERIEDGLPSAGWEVPDWHKYDYEYVAKFFGEEIAA